MTDIDTLKDSLGKNYSGQVKHVVEQEYREATRVDASEVLPEEIATRMPFDPYEHQAEATRALNAGDDIAISTSTSSGKTLTYALQIAQNHLQSPDSTSLLVYPTRALARDQHKALTKFLLNDLGFGDELDIGVYDGDTSTEEKQRIRRESNVVITNFAGVNHYLGTHEKWSRIYSNLELVVIDESHTYTGLLGMHVAWIIRRLQRVIDYYETDPQYVLSSATIGNPHDHARALIDREVTLINDDASERGRRDLVFWNPPADIQPDGTGDVTVESRRPADIEASDVLAHLASNEIQSLLFTSSRKLTELNQRRTNDAVSADIDISAYHAGLGRDTRQSIEDDLKHGTIDGAVTTTALELGVDIGDLDGTILAGYPGTRQSFWQQIGRAGRGTKDAISIFVANHSSIDQYIMNNPDYVVGDSVESAVIDLTNNQVYAQHVLCAASELPITYDDVGLLGEEPRLENAVDMWKRAGKLVGSLDIGVQYNKRDRPQNDVNLYASSDETFDVRADGADIDHEPVERQRAYRDFHEGAVVLHQDEEFVVKELNESVARPYILLEKQPEINYYTRSQSTTTISDLEVEESYEYPSFTLKWGTGVVNTHHDKYEEVDMESNQTQDIKPTNNGPVSIRTQLMWAEINEDVKNQLIEDHEPGGGADSSMELYHGALHALEHTMIGVAPLELMMDKRDLGGQSTLNHPETTTEGAFFIYDGVSGGVGFARTIHDNFETIAAKAQAVLTQCSCGTTRGCPACAMDENCGDDNYPLHTDGAADLLGTLITDIVNDS